MKDVDRLKSLDLYEKIGFFIKKHLLKSISIGIILFLLVSLISCTSSLILSSKKNTAEGYLKQAEQNLTKYDDTIQSTQKLLAENPKLYKEYDKYSNEIEKSTRQYQTLKTEFINYQKKFDNKDIKEILINFSHYKDKDNSRIIFPDKLTDNLKVVSVISNDVLEVNSLDKEFKTNMQAISSFKQNIETEQNKRNAELKDIEKNGKTISVKEKSKNLFENIIAKKNVFLNSYESIPRYSSSEEGKFTLQELKRFKSKYDDTLALIDKTNSALKDFDNYWNELHEQYYTVVTNNYFHKTKDYVTEPNPHFKEWQESEQYQDTETRYKTESYTEIKRVYVGSRVVGDKKQDIYENRTINKTKQVPYTVPVTKTRMVTRNNGKPRTISVPYDVYEHYYTIERHSKDGMTKAEKSVGKKHGKYDTLITSWKYASTEKIGYTIWKQLWNDNAGTITGQNVNPHLE